MINKLATITSNQCHTSSKQDDGERNMKNYNKTTILFNAKLSSNKTIFYFLKKKENKTRRKNISQSLVYLENLDFIG